MVGAAIFSKTYNSILYYNLIYVWKRLVTVYWGRATKWVSGCGWGTRCSAPAILHRQLCTRCSAPAILHREMCTRCSAPAILHREMCTSCSAPAIVHQVFCTSYFAPGVVHQLLTWYLAKMVNLWRDPEVIRAKKTRFSANNYFRDLVRGTGVVVKSPISQGKSKLGELCCRDLLPAWACNGDWGASSHHLRPQKGVGKEGLEGWDWSNRAKSINYAKRWEWEKWWLGHENIVLIKVRADTRKSDTINLRKCPITNFL